MNLESMKQASLAEDATLVAEARAGQREAFGQLVARYQSAISGLAYCSCGNLAQSEDLAQETFIIAWHGLGDLKEPAKFRSWLYGIARNLIHNSFRKETRNPIASSDPLDEQLPATSAHSNPTQNAISNEEEAILWRSLEQIPETYREALVLFYREHHSTERVAEILEVSEETARQRLSRGRKLLHERVIAFVEGALENTSPGPMFTGSVLSALPAAAFATKAATASAAAKGSAMTKGAATFAVAGAFLTPLLALFGMLVDYRMRKKAGLSQPLLRLLKGHYIFVFVSVLTMVVAISWLMDHGAAVIQKSPVLFVLLIMGSIIGYLTLVGLFVLRLARKMKEVEAASSIKTLWGKVDASWEYCSQLKFLGLPLVHIRFGRNMSPVTWKVIKGWIAITDGCAVGGFFAYGGISVAPLSIGAVSIGLVSYGAMALGAIAWGGFGFGGWVFGAFACGWEAFTGGCAIAWHLAWGYQYAIAHDYALGAGTVHAAQANTLLAEQMVKAAWGHDICIALTPYFYWLMWIWTIPMMLSSVLYFIRARQQLKHAANPAI